MDGFKARLSDSLQLRLSCRLSLAILGIAVIAGIFCFVAAFREAHEFQDEMLRQVATLFDEHGMSASTVGDSDAAADRDRESRVFVQRLDHEPASGTDDVKLALPRTLQEGMQTVDIGQGSFRVYVKTLQSGERMAFAQHTEVRDEIARHSAIATLLPFLLLVPLLVLTTAGFIRKMLKPIALLSAGIDRRCQQQLHPLDTQSLPSEIRPFVVAINRLLMRVSQSMQAQQRFIADAAHELRSPLAALSLQAERLANADMSPTARERLVILCQGIERGRALLEQLLSLARVQSPESEVARMVSVHRVFRRALEDLMPLAEAKRLNIGVTSEADVPVQVGEADLITLVKNLVDNAIRYAPVGGQIDLAVHAASAGVVIEIADTGPGIPASEWPRVFDPFYRVAGSSGTGSGLGLSIVATIAARARADVTLAYADEQAQAGLRVQVIFPWKSTIVTADTSSKQARNG
jgi:two-component system OmpR family sensor kinase